MQQTAVDVGAHPITLLGACQGLEGEAEATARALAQLEPATVALALGPEVASHVHALAEDPRLGVEDEAYTQGLRRYGDVRLPPPEFHAAIEAAADLDADVEGVDLPEEEYLDRFTDQIGVLDLARRALKIRWLRSRPPDAEAPETFCHRFDEQLNKGPFAALERQREARMARRLIELADRGPVALVVEVQRVPGIQAELERAVERPRP